MADNTITHGAPGIAEFGSETWGNVKEVRLQDTPPTATMPVTITAGANLDLPIWSVVSLVGLAVSVAAAAGPPATPLTSDAVGILPMPLVLASGQSVTVDVIVQGHFDYDALNFGPSFDTAGKKMAAFNARPAPIGIILGTNPYTSDGVLA